MRGVEKFDPVETTSSNTIAKFSGNATIVTIKTMSFNRERISQLYICTSEPIQTVIYKHLCTGGSHQPGSIMGFKEREYGTSPKEKEFCGR